MHPQSLLKQHANSHIGLRYVRLARIKHWLFVEGMRAAFNLLGIWRLWHHLEVKGVAATCSSSSSCSVIGCALANGVGQRIGEVWGTGIPFIGGTVTNCLYNAYVFLTSASFPASGMHT